MLMECSILLMGNTVEMAGGWHRYTNDKLWIATNLIIGLASAYIQSGSHVLLNGLVCNPFGHHFCLDLVTTKYDLSPILSPFVPDLNRNVL